MCPVVVLPWWGGCKHRQRARRWVRASYGATWPHWGISEGKRVDGPWCKGRSTYKPLRNAKDGCVVVADADVWCEPAAVERAVLAVTAGAAPWAMPHRLVKRLTEGATARYMEQGVVGDLERPAYEGIWGGGMVVAHRDLLLEVPLDPRFEGWGGEDESWALALDCLAGKGWRGDDDLIHLYHPQPDKPPGKWGSPTNRRLRQRYGHAGADRHAMELLIGEARAAY